MKRAKLIISILCFLALSFVIDYARIHNVLINDKDHDWTRYENHSTLRLLASNFLSYIEDEISDFNRQFRSVFRAKHSKSSSNINVNIYIPGKEEVRFKKDQKNRYNISRFKSQILRKTDYKAFFMNNQGDTSKIKITNVGMNSDHYFMTGDEWSSFRIKFGKSNNPYGRKSKKSILRGASRAHGLDYFANCLFSDLCGGIKVSSSPVNLFINGKEYYDYIIEDTWDKYLIEANHRREGSIIEVGFNGIIRSSDIKQDSLYYSMNSYVPSEKQKVFEFTEGMNEGTPNLDLIDLDKLNVLLLLCRDFFGGHPLLDINLHWYHNPVTNLFEPTIRETVDTNFLMEVFEDTTNYFAAYYINRQNIDFDSLRHRYYSNYNLGIIEHVTEIYPDINRSRLQEINDFIRGYTRDTLELTSARNNSDTIRYKSKHIISEDIVISKHQTLFVEDGAELIFTGDANLKVYGTLLLDGRDKRIKLHAKGNNSIYVKSSQKCKIWNSDFLNFSNLIDSVQYHYLPSALTFYETKVEIKNSTFTENLRGDDYVNFFRCPDVSIEGCLFENVLSDAVDGDFSNLNIVNCSFSNIGNDGVDVSGSKLSLSYTSFKKVSDKGVSGGEASTIDVKSCTFVDNEIAIVSKDGTVLYFRDCLFKQNKLDISAFQKKLEYAKAEIYSENAMDLSCLIEEGVKTNLQFEIVKDVKKKMYGKEYGRATEK